MTFNSLASMPKFGKVVFATAFLALFSSCSHTGAKSTASVATSVGGVVSVNSNEFTHHDEQTLANGMQILFFPDDKLPYLTFELYVNSGSDSDPDGLSGVSALTADLLDRGTVRRSAVQIANDLGFLGTEFGATVNYDYSMFGLSGLANQANVLLENFHELITQPEFSEGEIERTKKQVESQIQRRVDQADAYADFAFANMLYGKHPYGRSPSGTIKSVEAIKRKDIIQQYLRYYRPNNSRLAVIGKFNPDTRYKIVEAFSSWTSRDQLPQQFPPIEDPKGITVRIVNKPKMVQAQIRVGYPGIRRKNDDFMALHLASTILGESFTSRLNDRIRKQLGLTYSISSAFDARRDRGPFEIETFTKSETVGQTVFEILKVLGEFAANGATADEVERTKGYLKGTFPTVIETPEKMAQMLLVLRGYDIPDSYLNNYLTTVDHLNGAEINRVIKKYFQADNVDILVYADAKTAEPQLKAALGDKVKIEIVANTNE